MKVEWRRGHVAFSRTMKDRHKGKGNGHVERDDDDHPTDPFPASSSSSSSSTSKNKKKYSKAASTAAPEIVLSILESIPFADPYHTSTLLSSSLVCKAWSPISQSLLFRFLDATSYRSLRLIERAFVLNPTLGTYARFLLFPILQGRPPFNSANRMTWRHQGIIDQRTGREMAISPRGYMELQKVYRRIAMKCPNLEHVNLPYYIPLDGESIELGPEFTLDLDQVENIKSVCVYPPPFVLDKVVRKQTDQSSSSSPPNDHEENTVITFPNAHSLSLHYFPQFASNPYRQWISLPHLSNLQLSLDLRAFHPDLISALISQFSHTLRSLSVTWRLVYEDDFDIFLDFWRGIEEPAAQVYASYEYLPWYTYLPLPSSPPLDQQKRSLKNLTHLSLNALPQTLFHRPLIFSPLPSLTHLNLNATATSSFSEISTISLEEHLPSLEYLQIWFDNGKTELYAWNLVQCLSKILKKTEGEGGEGERKLKNIQVHMIIRKEERDVEMSKVLAFLIVEKGKRVGVVVEFDWVLSTYDSLYGWDHHADEDPYDTTWPSASSATLTPATRGRRTRSSFLTIMDLFKTPTRSTTSSASSPPREPKTDEEGPEEEEEEEEEMNTDPKKGGKKKWGKNKKKRRHISKHELANPWSPPRSKLVRMADKGLDGVQRRVGKMRGSWWR